MKTLVLGAGRVGSAIARDLARDGWPVTVADRSADATAAATAGTTMTAITADLASPDAVAELAAAHQLVIGALPSFLGFAALRAVLEARRPYVDISFFEEDPFELDDLARRNGVTAVVDCGVAPGLDNLLLGRLMEEMERVDRFVCYVGGLPRERTLPWEYKAPFAPYDVLAEYTRPARWVEAGDVRSEPPLGHRELLDFAGVGTLETFLTDGLRTLLTTCEVPFMQEKTLRYPGHAERIALLRDAGFLSTAPIAVGEDRISPLALTSRLLLPAWELGEADDLTAFRVVVEGIDDGRPARRVIDLLDRRDASGVSSMARTTGYTCAAVARLVADGTWSRPGVAAPEHLGRDAECHRRVLADLAARGMPLEARREMLDA